jgi:hypothetical protein
MSAARRLSPSGLWPVLALALLLTSSSAAAYCRSTTCDPARDALACSPDELGCSTIGVPLFWPNACVTYAVQQLGSPRRGISAETADQAMRAGFRAWLSAECTDATTPSIGVIPLGGARCDRAEFNEPREGRAGAPNANLVIFRDDAWRHADEGSVIARTCLTFDATTGAILDADIEVNSLEVELSTDDVEISNDLQAILTHEIGHFLGLDHSHAPGATMQEDYERADLGARTLSSDDEAGICSIYAPVGEEPVQCPASTGPRNGYSRDCGSNARADASCLSLASGSSSPSGGHAAVGLLLLLSLGWRRRRCRR